MFPCSRRHGLSQGVPGGAPRCLPTLSPCCRPAELWSLQAPAAEGFGSSCASNSSSFTSCRTRFTKAASSRLGRRSFSSKPSRQSGQAPRCFPLQYWRTQGRQKLWPQSGSRTGSAKCCRQQAQLSSTARSSRPRGTAAAMARPGAERSRAAADFRFPQRLFPCSGRALPRYLLLWRLLGSTGTGQPRSSQETRCQPSSSSTGNLVRGFGLTADMNCSHCCSHDCSHVPQSGP